MNKEAAMKYMYKSLGKMPSAFLLSVLFLSIYLGLVSCATKKPIPQPPASEPPRTVSFRFAPSLVVSAPAGEPATVREHVRCGLFYFQHNRYEEAAKSFQAARGPILDPANDLSRQCIVAEAVCQLLSDNKPAFVKTVNALKATYNKYELMTVEQRDSRMKALMDVQSAFARIGYR